MKEDGGRRAEEAEEKGDEWSYTRGPITAVDTTVNVWRRWKRDEAKGGEMDWGGEVEQQRSAAKGYASRLQTLADAQAGG